MGILQIFGIKEIRTEFFALKDVTVYFWKTGII